ncbi:MAG: DUF4783 domain-containing protein [Bacteroidia bacterium]
MKTIIRLLSVTALLGVLSFSIKQVDYKPFEIALKTSNAKGLAQFFDEQIELSILGGEFNIQNSYSRSQAQTILENFFSENDVKTFETKHSGQSTWSKYIIGYLQTEDEKYRGLIRYLNSDGKLTIQELELTLENE